MKFTSYYSLFVVYLLLKNYKNTYNSLIFKSKFLRTKCSDISRQKFGNILKPKCADSACE